MANVETTDAAVSNHQVEADSLEFGVNTNLSVMANSASPKGASPSLQELIEAELNVRLCQPDSLETPASLDPSSLLSCDSIEPEPHPLIPSLSPPTAPAPITTKGLTLDSLIDLDSLQDSTGMADTESGIDVLSPTKLDDISNLDVDSLESSSDLPASSHSSLEPTTTLTTQESSVVQKDTLMTLVQIEDSPLLGKNRAPSPKAESPLLGMREGESDAASLGDLQAAPPLLRISESNLTIVSETRSELSQVSQEVTRSSTPDSLTSMEGGAVPEDTSSPQDSDAQEVVNQDGALLESILLQNSTALPNAVIPDVSAPCVSECVVVHQNNIESQDIHKHTFDLRLSEKISPPHDNVSPLESTVLQENTVFKQESSITPDDAILLDISQQQGVNGQMNVDEKTAAGDLISEETKLIPSPESNETPAEPTSPLLQDLVSLDPLSSPHGQDCSFPSPSPAGALPLNGTNSVCGGDFLNSSRDDRGDVSVSSGRVDTVTTAVCSSSGGGCGGVSGTVTSLENGPNMEPQVDEEEEDFWGSKNDDDDFVSRRPSNPGYDHNEDDTTAEAKEEEEEEEEEEKQDVEEEKEEDEGHHLLGSDEDDVTSSKGAKGLRFKKRTTRTENGVGGIEKKVVEEVEKKTKIEEIGGKKIEVTTEKKTIQVKEERKKGDVKEEKKREVKEEVEKKKKEVVEDEEKENGVVEEITEKKKKKKHRDSEDGEREKIRRKKKKKRDSEKENKEASSSSSGNEQDSEAEAPLPTPPLFNGHAILHDASNGYNGDHVKDDTLNDEEFLIHHETDRKEDFHSLLHAYNDNSSPAKESRDHAVLSDEEDLAGVSVKQLRVSYLSAAQDTTKVVATPHKTDVKEEIKADLNTSVNISSLVDTYTSAQQRPVTPSRPDDLTPVSLQSLKSAYEATATATATATGASSTVSRHSSSGSSSPTSGSPAPREELNVSLHQLREEYCRSVEGGHSRSHTPSRQPLETGVSIRQLQVSQVSSECRQCGKQVFQMEKIVAEKASWHKNCFRCKECNCILTLETYQSHEGVLYCKPHFKELFRPKVVVEDPDEARKERSTNQPDYGLDDLSHANLKQKFKMFEQISTEEERTPETIPVRRSQSLLNKAARFMQSDEEYGIENSELGEYEEDEEDEDEDEEDEEEDEEGEGEEGEGKLKKKSRATSFSGMKDLKAGFARKNRQDELTKKRRQELSKFRQMLCAGKNISTREIFETGNEDDKDKLRRKEQIKIDGRPDAKNLRERFEKGFSIIESDSEDNGEKKEVDRVFKDADTANKARNLFKQIDKTVAEGGEAVMRPHTSAVARRENRLSRDGIDVEELELGRDPNLVKCTDNYEDEVDCRGTRKLLAKFRKLEMQSEDMDKGPRAPKQFTPPPEGEEEYDSDEEYSDEEYSDEDEDDSEEDSEEDSENEKKPKYRDEVLDMVKSSQSAKKAASLRAKFEKWESKVERNNEYNQNNERYEEEDECMPSIDTARNLRAMFENKAQEVTLPVNERPKVKVNRFVGGGGDKCMLCDHTVYAMERLEVAGRVLHKNCFKCCKCSTKLSMNTFSIGGDDMYCTTHYKQAFTEKGTYDVFTPNKGSPVKTP